MNGPLESSAGALGVDPGLEAARLGAPPGGILTGDSVDGLLEALLGVAPPGRILLSASLQETWAPRLDALGRPWEALVLEGRGALETLMEAVAQPLEGDQVWLNLDRTPALDAMDLLTLEAFLAFAGSRPRPPLVVLMRDDTPVLGRTQRMAVDRLGNLLLLRETPGGAYALGMPALISAFAQDRPLRSIQPPSPPGGNRHLLVLDVDGVLIDPGRSFATAVANALAELAPGLAWNDSVFAAFKRVGGFNNDFRLTAGAVALGEAGGLEGLEAAAGVGFPHLDERILELEPVCRAAVRKAYVRTRGLERALVTRQDLEAFAGDLAIFTGRPPQELAMAFEVLRFRLPAVSDGAPHLRKPRPEGLLQLADTFRAQRITFVGDTCDDAAALRGARALRPDLDWTFAAVGPGRAAFAALEDLQANGLLDLLPALSSMDSRRRP